MQPIIAALRYNARNLARMSGRDPRGLFWPWAIALVIAMQVAVAVALIPSQLRLTRLALQNPDRSQMQIGSGGYQVRVASDVPGVGDLMAGSLIPIALVALLMLLLLAAAVVRRLHDTGRTGAWGLLPVPFLLGGFILMPMAIRDPGAGLFAAAFFNNVIYLALLVILIVMLARKGTDGSNRYGEPPSPFNS